MTTQLLMEIFDKETEDFLYEIDLSNYDLKMINKICPPEEGLDYNYTDGREIDKNDVHNLSKFIVELKDLKFEKYSMGIITRRI